MRKCFQTLICLVALQSASSLAAQDLAVLANFPLKLRGLLSRLSEKTTDFSAVLHYQILDAQGKPQQQMMMDISMTTQSIRSEFIVSASSQIPENHRVAMKAIGVDRIIFILHMDTRKMYIMFPGSALFQEIQIKDGTFAEEIGRSSNLVIQQTEIGSENVNGYSCARTLVEFVETNRPPEKGIVWYANDLQRWPARITWRQDKLLHVYEFKGVQLTTPNPALFQIPTNYIRVERIWDVLRIRKERLEKGEAGPKSPH